VEVLEKLVSDKRIEVPDDLIVGASVKKSLSRLITKLNKAKIFDKMQIPVLEKYKEELPELSYKIEGGKVFLNDIKSLKDFVDACSRNFLRDIASNDIYRSTNKTLIKKGEA